MNLAKFPRKKYTESYTPIETIKQFFRNTWWADYLF